MVENKKERDFLFYYFDKKTKKILIIGFSNARSSFFSSLAASTITVIGVKLAIFLSDSCLLIEVISINVGQSACNVRVFLPDTWTYDWLTSFLLFKAKIQICLEVFTQKKMLEVNVELQIWFFYSYFKKSNVKRLSWMTFHPRSYLSWRKFSTFLSLPTFLSFLETKQTHFIRNEENRKCRAWKL